jgi:tetratricopeptide (TPR) repeat protein
MNRYTVGAGILAALLLLGADARAQTGTARGKVVDEQGQPVPDAKVTIEFQGGVTRKFEVKTNQKGEYIQVGLAPGTYKFTVNKEGHRGSFLDEKVNLGDPTVIPDLKLMAAAAATAKAAEGISGPFAAATNLTREGKLDEAEAAFKEILTKYPSVPEVHYNLGYIYSQKKDWAAAEAAYQKAAELRPGYVDAWMALHRVYMESGQKDKAADVMKQAVATNGENPTVQFNLGVAYLNAQQLDEAEAAFQKVQTLDPSNVEVLYYLGTIAINKGKTADCIALMEKYLASSPKNAQNVATAQGLVAALKKK